MIKKWNFKELLI